MFTKIKEFLDRHKYKILAGVSFALAGYAFYEYCNDDSRIKLSAFLEALQSNQLDQVVVQGDTIYFRSSLSDWFHTYLGNYPISLLFQQLKNCKDLKYSCQQDDKIGPLLVSLALATSTSYLTMRFLMPQKFGTINKFPKIVNNNQTFKNFYGSEEIKTKLKQLIQYLNDKQKYQLLGGRIRKGILLYGPPGTGKTMLAKTLANEANLPFIQTCASQFQEIYVGVGPKKIRDIFTRAKQCKQGCIIFIDQLDAIGTRADGRQFSRETTATINQLLTELDGFSQNQNIVVIGATNRVELVDSALIRAGRFDIKVKLHLPNLQERKGIFKTLLSKKNVPNEITEQFLNELGENSQGWSGADLQALINESIFRAVREKEDKVSDQHVRQALQDILVK